MCLWSTRNLSEGVGISRPSVRSAYLTRSATPPELRRPHSVQEGATLIGKSLEVNSTLHLGTGRPWRMEAMWVGWASRV